MDNQVEIVIVDDGSTDEIKEKVDGLQQKYSMYRLVFLSLADNGGVARARNKGIEIATGEWILLLDSDDKVLQEAFSIFEEYINRYPNVVSFAFGATNSKGESTVHCKNGEHLGKDVCDWFDKSNYDGEFMKLTKIEVCKEFPFYEGLNGGEGIKWYQQWKKYYNRTLHTEKRTRFYNTDNIDSLMRQEMSEKKLLNSIKIAEKRLEVMEDDLRKYQPRGKDGLAMSYAVLGKYYILLGNKKNGWKYTWQCLKIDITEKRWVRNVLLLLGILKK